MTERKTQPADANVAGFLADSADEQQRQDSFAVLDQRWPRVGRNRLSAVVFAVATLLSLVAGCTTRTTEPINTESVPEIADRSLTPEEYIRLGLPAHDREWSGQDMRAAEQVYAALAERGAAQFPRHQSPRSGAVFARQTSAENLEFFKNRTLPLETRISEALEYLQGANQIMKLYLAAFQKRQVADAELIEQVSAQMRFVVVMSQLVDELLPTIPHDDPDYTTRMQGVDRMRRGMATMVAGGLLTLTERKHYRCAQLVKLISTMQETFPVIVPRLPAGARAETAVRLEKMQTETATRDLQPHLAELAAKVNAALARTPPD